MQNPSDDLSWCARTYRNMTLLKAFVGGFLLGVTACFAALLALAGPARAVEVIPVEVHPIVVEHPVEPVSHPIDVDDPVPRMVPGIPRVPVRPDTSWLRTPKFVCRYSPVLSTPGQYELWLCARAAKK
jgi:hypothetical protein